MVEERYPVEKLDEDYDDGTMVESKNALTDAVVGRRIVSIEQAEEKRERWDDYKPWIITLDTGEQVEMVGRTDCCAYTELEAFVLHPERVDHAITGVGTTDGYTKWHIYADAGDVLELSVGWSCGNPFYYAYGFDIRVKPLATPSSSGDGS